MTKIADVCVLLTDSRLPNHEMNPYIKLEYGLALAVKKACNAHILAINGSRCNPMMEIRRKQ